jgi:hypothetical protein
VSLTTLLSFWKKKETTAPEPQRIIPLPSLPAPRIEPTRSTSQEAVGRAREALKILRLERQILGSAVTTIYESQTKGQISQAERDQLLEKYKVDLKRLEKGIDENQKVVDLYELESAREDLVKSFNAKIAEIDSRLKDLKSGTSSSRVSKEGQEPKPDTAKDKNSNHGQGDHGNSTQRHAKETRTKEDDPEISDAEKRVNQIREEVLKAMDRLEQIEAEG